MRFELLQVMLYLQEKTLPVVVQMNVSTLLIDGLSWHLVLLHLLVFFLDSLAKEALVVDGEMSILRSVRERLFPEMTVCIRCEKICFLFVSKSGTG